MFSATLASKLASEAKAVDVGTLEVYRAVQICQQEQGKAPCTYSIGTLGPIPSSE